MNGESDIAAQVADILDSCPQRRKPGRFTVVCPVYNRARTLPQALDSLLAQTYEDWLCLILDDGSTDGSADIAEDYARRDPRFRYVRFAENRGGVVMNEIGMRAACELGQHWSRLGSDDWFEPHKLMVDYVTLGRNELPACFGPFRCDRGNFLDSILCGQRIDAPPPRPSRFAMIKALRKVRARFAGACDILHSPPVDARGTLLSGDFAMSWANAAARTEVLRQVRDRFGGFCDLQIRNMEDFHCNARIASVSNIVWRGLKKDMRTLVIGARTWAEAGDERDFVHDGVWRVARDGASNRRERVAVDKRITVAAIQKDFSIHAPEQVPAVPPRVVSFCGEPLL